MEETKWWEKDVPYEEDKEWEAYKEEELAAEERYRQAEPQWHDLRKDPFDLPKVSGRYLLYLSDGCMGVQMTGIFFGNLWCPDGETEEKQKVVFWRKLGKSPMEVTEEGA